MLASGSSPRYERNPQAGTALWDPAEAEVLLHARQDGEYTTFVVIDEASGQTPAQGAPVLDDEGLFDELPVLLAQRDVERMGGDVTVHAGSPDHHRVSVRLPNGAREGGAA